MSSKESSDSSKPLLTDKELLFQSVPLILTFLMMSGAAPIVTDGITTSFNAELEKLHLPAFALTFSIALVIYSPCFTSRNVSIRTFKNSANIKNVITVYFCIAAFCTILLLLVALFEPLSRFVFISFLGSDENTYKIASKGLLAFLPCPLFLVFRAFAQSIHIIRRNTWIVGIGSLARLCSMAAFIYLAAVNMEISGPVMGGLAFSIGVGTELILNALFLRKYRNSEPESDNTKIMSIPSIWNYISPLLLSIYLTRFLTPVVFYIIKSTQNSEEGLGGYQLFHSTMWVSLSLLFSIQPIILNFADSKVNFRKIITFNLKISVFIIICLYLLTFTDLKVLFYEDFMKVDNRIILDFLYTTLPLTLILPFINLSSLTLIALHTRSGHTKWLAFGNIAGYAALLIFSTIPVGNINGTTLAVVCYIIFDSVNIIVLLFGLKYHGIESCFTESINVRKKESTA